MRAAQSVFAVLWARGGSVLGMLGLWFAVAHLSQDFSVLPPPEEVAQVFWAEFAHGPLAGHVLATLGRVVAAFALAMGLGTALGLCLGRYRRLDDWADPVVTVFLNTPALVVIVLCYLWIGLNEVAAIVAVAVNKTAMVTVTMREGMRARDPELSEMARVYRMGRVAYLRDVLLPQLAPFIVTATRNGLAVIWKIVLVVEFLGRPDGVGFQIHLYFQMFDVATVLAYSLSFVAVMLAVEMCLIRPLADRQPLYVEKKQI